MRERKKEKKWKKNEKGFVYDFEIDQAGVWGFSPAAGDEQGAGVGCWEWTRPHTFTLFSSSLLFLSP